MASLNKVQLIGRLGKDPELKHTKTQLAVTNLSLATTEMSKGANGDKVEKTEWHKIVLFGKTAENVCKYLKKGSMAYVEGRLSTRQYEKDGVNHNSTEIMADNVVFLDSKSGAVDPYKPANPVAITGDPFDVSSNASWSQSPNPFGTLSDLPF